MRQVASFTPDSTGRRRFGARRRRAGFLRRSSAYQITVPDLAASPPEGGFFSVQRRPTLTSTCVPIDTRASPLHLR